ncbi:Leucine rich repeat-containing protein [Butyrivibrio sp. ob235]|uniref:leucine-rich repeat protein n=1 Tax=Butyrivibrio sp. ob235 TaxID=1761780 RepID=UPI0008CD1135|nr:leucine-rich repeat protein [Butyrivibrio sp. ob235]SEM45029.1 Leucine rich repeat-containing protein [Butyrivibrio sp. ob235]
MNNINTKLKRIMALTLAVAMVFSIAAVFTLTAKASGTHSAGYDAVCAWMDSHTAVEQCDVGTLYLTKDNTEGAQAMMTLTRAEAAEIDNHYFREQGSSLNPVTNAWNAAWREAYPDVPGMEVGGWAWEAAHPEAEAQRNAASQPTTSSSSNSSSTSASTNSNNDSSTQKSYYEIVWEEDPSTDPETYGWSRDSFSEALFKHHNVGFTFVSKSGIKFRVTKEGGYHKLGHVEIIGYQPDSSSGKVDDSNVYQEFLKNQPNTMHNKGNMLEILACDYTNDKREIVKTKRGRTKKKIAARSGFEGRNEDLATYYEDMVVDTHVDGIFDRKAYSYHEFFLITSIAPGAFKGNTSLEYVYIPESVQTIPKDCFKGCTNLREVYWGSNSLKYVKGHGLMTASGTPKYNAKKKICKGAFAKCKKLKKFCLDGLYADIKVEKGAFDKDKKAITVGAYKCKNKYTKNFAKNIKSKGKAKKAAKTKKYDTSQF